MTPAARTVALSLSLIQQKADRLREHDDLPKRAKTRRARAITCRARLDRTYQRYRYAVAVAGDLPAEHYAARRELRASIGSYRQALYELVAIAWIFAETAPNDRFAAYRLSDIDELQPSRIQHHLGELHHLLLRRSICSSSARVSPSLPAAPTVSKRCSASSIVCLANSMSC